MITKNPSPISIAKALPRLITVSVFASWIHHTIIAQRSLPSAPAITCFRFRASSMLQITSIFTNSLLTINSCPVGMADFFTSFIANVVSKVIVAWATEGQTRGIEIVLIANYSNTVGNSSVFANVIERLPIRWWEDFVRVCNLFNDF